MNFGCIFLLFISEDHQVDNEVSIDKNKKDTEVKANTNTNNIPLEDNLYNPVLISAMVHKVLSGLTMMGVKY